MHQRTCVYGVDSLIFPGTQKEKKNKRYCFMLVQIYYREKSTKEKTLYRTLRYGAPLLIVDGNFTSGSKKASAINLLFSDQRNGN